MIGLDTGFLIAWALTDHPAHRDCRARLEAANADGQTFAVTSGVLAEFIHVVTDPRRFRSPLTMEEAVEQSRFWIQPPACSVLAPTLAANLLWLDWMNLHRLGRKRVLDTLLAATWCTSGIAEVWTLNPADFTVFDCFRIWSPPADLLHPSL